MTQISIIRILLLYALHWRMRLLFQYLNQNKNETSEQHLLLGGLQPGSVHKHLRDVQSRTV